MAWAGGIAIGLVLGWVSSLIVRAMSARRHHVDIEAAKARTAAEIRVIHVGRDEALRRVDEEYADALQELDAQQAIDAEALMHDPGARAEYLARVLAKQRKRKSD